MARFEGRSFRGERLPLEGHEYINCNFEDCVMVFSGSDGPMTMTENRFGAGSRGPSKVQRSEPLSS